MVGGCGGKPKDRQAAFSRLGVDYRPADHGIEYSDRQECTFTIRSLDANRGFWNAKTILLLDASTSLGHNRMLFLRLPICCCSPTPVEDQPQGFPFLPW